MLVRGANSALGDDILNSLYIKNGKSIDGEPLELFIRDGKIIEMAPILEDIKSDSIIDLQGHSYVSAGWIDDHVHCYKKLDLYYDDPDQVGYLTGVTTVIDAGSTGADNIGDFYQVTRNNITNVYALINISRTGILAQNELGDLQKVDFEVFESAVEQYANFVVGMKARISKSVVIDNGVKPLIMAKEFQNKLKKDLPLMVHVGTNPPELSEILSLMTKGDILTHCFNGKPNGILNSDKSVKDFVFEALKRGIIFDIGHGTDSFNFETAKNAKRQGIFPQTLSTDIYHRNREEGPVYSMATCVEKLLCLGYDLKTVIPMITSTPAKNFHLSNKGSLKVGFDADITIFNVEDKNEKLTDSNGNNCYSTVLIEPIYSVVAGNAYLIGE